MHLGGGGRAVLRVFVQQADDEGIEGGRNRLVPGARWDGGGVQVLGDDGEWIAGDEGQAAGGQLVEHDTQGIEVGPTIESTAQCEFRRQVGHGAGAGAFPGEARGRALSQAKAHHLHDAGCPGRRVR